MGTTELRLMRGFDVVPGTSTSEWRDGTGACARAGAANDAEVNDGSDRRDALAEGGGAGTCVLTA